MTGPPKTATSYNQGTHFMTFIEVSLYCSERFLLFGPAPCGWMRSPPLMECRLLVGLLTSHPGRNQDRWEHVDVWDCFRFRMFVLKSLFSILFLSLSSGVFHFRITKINLKKEIKYKQRPFPMFPYTGKHGGCVGLGLA